MEEFHQATHGASILQQRTSVHLLILPVDIEVRRCPPDTKKQFFGGWVVFTSDFLHQKKIATFRCSEMVLLFFFLVSGRFFEDENIQQFLAFFGLFSRKLSGPSLAKHLPFLLCISVIPPISMVCGIIL